MYFDRPEAQFRASVYVGPGGYDEGAVDYAEAYKWYSIAMANGHLAAHSRCRGAAASLKTRRGNLGLLVAHDLRTPRPEAELIAFYTPRPEIPNPSRQLRFALLGEMR